MGSGKHEVIKIWKGKHSVPLVASSAKKVDSQNQATGQTKVSEEQMIR